MSYPTLFGSFSGSPKNGIWNCPKIGPIYPMNILSNSEVRNKPSSLSLYTPSPLHPFFVLLFGSRNWLLSLFLFLSFDYYPILGATLLRKQGQINAALAALYPNYTPQETNNPNWNSDKLFPQKWGKSQWILWKNVQKLWPDEKDIKVRYQQSEE